MSGSYYTRFLTECFVRNPERQLALSEDEIYGVYVSWCMLNGRQPGPARSLWAAMDERGHAGQQRGTGQHEWPGLAMKGPAAVDYILSSQPSLL